MTLVDSGTSSLKSLGNKELWRLFTEYDEVPEEVKDEVRRRVHMDTPAGYRWFYRIVRQWPMPPYGPDWIKDLYDSEGRWVNEAFRGSTKTTAITETFTAYQIGLHPERSNGFAQASDESAKAHAKNVADLIESNAGFQFCFPNLAPDKERGWGTSGGFWVKRTDVNYSEWVRVRHKDPTLYAGSYGNAIHIGKHPTGVFIFDDVNDQKNSESDRMSRELNDWIRDTMFPALENTRWRIFNQTPWTKKDALAMVKATGVWKHTRTPVLTPVEPDHPQARHVFIEKNGIVLYDQYAKLTWPENFTPKKIAEKYVEQLEQNTGGTKGFARMYLLDLTKMEGRALKKEWLIGREYPAEKIKEEWPIFMGCDYASAADNVRGDGDYFCVAVVALAQDGKRVVLDGIRAKLSQGQAEQKLKAIALSYPTLQAIGIERDGVGKEFYSLIARTTSLPVVPMGTKRRDKGFRFEKIMAPHFEFGKARLAEDKTPFLTAFIDEWLAYPDGDHDDTLDATFYALAASGLFYEDAVQTVKQAKSAWYEKRERKVNPWKVLGTHGAN